MIIDFSSSASELEMTIKNGRTLWRAGEYIHPDQSLVVIPLLKGREHLGDINTQKQLVINNTTESEYSPVVSYKLTAHEGLYVGSINQTVTAENNIWVDVDNWCLYKISIEDDRELYKFFTYYRGVSPRQVYTTVLANEVRRVAVIGNAYRVNNLHISTLRAAINGKIKIH